MYATIFKTVLSLLFERYLSISKMIGDIQHSVDSSHYGGVIILRRRERSFSFSFYEAFLHLNPCVVMLLNDNNASFLRND